MAPPRTLDSLRCQQKKCEQERYLFYFTLEANGRWRVMVVTLNEYDATAWSLVVGAKASNNAHTFVLN
jgi:hypothetical protein